MPPNLLLVVLDDVGTDGLAAYGEQPDAPPTPVISALAADGVLFRNAWAAPVCGPSRAMLLTGRYSRRFGMGANIEDRDDPWRLPAAEVLLPARLAPAGYTSLALGKWHLASGTIETETGEPEEDPLRDPLNRGFRTHIGTAGNVSDYFAWESYTDGISSDRQGYLTSAVVDDALAELRRLPEPWFLYVAFHAPHAPWQVPPEPLAPTGVAADDGDAALYDAMLVALDTEIGRLLDGIDPAARERTHIALVGDNGAPAQVITPPFDPERGKMTMFEGGINVPLIIAGPAVGAPGTESAALVHLVDVLPTFTELAGASAPGPALDGISLVPQLADPGAPGRAIVWTERLRGIGPPPWPNEMNALRDGRYKLVVEAGVESLFDLAGRHDDGEALPLDALDPEAAAALDRLRMERERVLATVGYEGD